MYIQQKSHRVYGDPYFWLPYHGEKFLFCCDDITGEVVGVIFCVGDVLNWYCDATDDIDICPGVIVTGANCWWEYDGIVVAGSLMCAGLKGSCDAVLLLGLTVPDCIQG